MFQNVDEAMPQFQANALNADVYKVQSSVATLLHSYIQEAIDGDDFSRLQRYLKKPIFICDVDSFNADNSDFLNETQFQMHHPEFEAPDCISQKVFDPSGQQTLPSGIYKVYSLAKAIGCPHRITGCQIKCKTCSKFYPCERCHDHFETDHNHVNSMDIRCCYCNKSQFVDKKCANCGKKFGNYFCMKCKIISDLDPKCQHYFHCEACDQCHTGDKSLQVKCAKCGLCYQSSAEPHFCDTDAPEQILDTVPEYVIPLKCCLCGGQFEKTLDKKYICLELNCFHLIHEYCYKQMLMNDVIQCPQCNSFLPLDQDAKKILASRKFKFENTLIQKSFEFTTAQVYCYDCNTFQIQFYSPCYYCLYCKSWNTEEHGTNFPIEQDQVQLLLNEYRKQKLQRNIMTVENIKDMIIRRCSNVEDPITQVFKMVNIESEQDPELMSKLEFVGEQLGFFNPPRLMFASEAEVDLQQNQSVKE